MATELTAALIAAVVSLVGILVSLHVSRRERRAGLLGLRIQSQLEDQKAIMENIRTVESCAEKTRSWSWDILGILSSGPQFALAFSDPVKVREFQKGFDAKKRDLEDAWSQIRGDLPRAVTDYVRGIRYSYLTRLAVCDAACSLLHHAFEQGDNDRIQEEIERLGSALRSLLDELDLLIRVLSSIRSEMLYGGRSAEPSPPAYPKGRADAPSGSAEA